jgi:hypothetical protein
MSQNATNHIHKILVDTVSYTDMPRPTLIQKTSHMHNYIVNSSFSSYVVYVELHTLHSQNMLLMFSGCDTL